MPARVAQRASGRELGADWGPRALERAVAHLLEAGCTVEVEGLLLVCGAQGAMRPGASGSRSPNGANMPPQPHVAAGVEASRGVLCGSIRGGRGQTHGPTNSRVVVIFATRCSRIFPRKAAMPSIKY